MKRKLTSAEKAERKRRKALFTTVFQNGKMKRIPRIDPLVEGVPLSEFMLQNGNVAELMEHKMWEHLPRIEANSSEINTEPDDDIPF
jgi:hypothetical protein